MSDRRRHCLIIKLDFYAHSLLTHILDYNYKNCFKLIGIYLSQANVR